MLVADDVNNDDFYQDEDQKIKSWLFDEQQEWVPPAPGGQSGTSERDSAGAGRKPAEGEGS